jgi:hypothetical protein
MTECTQKTFEFQGIGKRKVTADFSGGHLSSDGGGLLIREMESRMGLVKKIASCFEDGRDQRFVEHRLECLIAQRLFGISLGYEDLNDHDRLRLDPLHAVFVGNEDVLGQNRLSPNNQGKALAGRATLNRIELGAEELDGRYKKIAAQQQKLEKLLIEEGVKAIPRRSRQIILDFDATDDPLHGQQEGAYFNGYYRSYCYLPLYCFCGSIPLWAELRDCKRDACDGTVEALKRIVPAIRKRFGRKVRIVLRADSGFAREEILKWCEDHGLYYVVGMPRNDRLYSEIEDLFVDMEQTIESGQLSMPCRRFKEFFYQTLKSWSCKRRLIGKAEILSKGRNPRFIITNFPSEGFVGEDAKCYSSPAWLYEKLYCSRGDMENRIKEEQLDLFADRTSAHWMGSNQLRLWFSAFAHLIFSKLRAEVLCGTELAKATVGQIRLKLMKIGARVRVSCRRVHLELVSAYPWQETFIRAYQNLINFSP